MKAEEFVDHLSTVAPDLDDLLDYGLDQDEIKELLDSYTCVLKENVYSGFDSELDKLVGQFDCSGVEIGLVSFIYEPVKTHHGKLVGRFESDYICVRDDGRVVVIDHASELEELMNCADDSEKFLSALAECANIIKNKSLWRGRAVEAARTCAKKAGAEGDYERFYRIQCAFLGET